MISCNSAENNRFQKNPAASTRDILPCEKGYSNLLSAVVG
jgi:hypothetical protein